MTEGQRREAFVREIIEAVDRYLARGAGAGTQGADPVEYWINHWPPRLGEVDPSNDKLWLTKKRAEKELGCGKTKIDELVREYDISVLFGGRHLINRYRSFAAMHGNLPPRSKTGGSGQVR